MNSQKLFWITSSFILVLGSVACGDDENAGPSDASIPTFEDAGRAGSGGSGGTGGNAGGGDDDGGAGVGGQGGQGGEAGTSVVGIDAGPSGLPDCDDEPTNSADKCWDLTECEGQESKHFLEQCSDNCVAPFDNNTRIEGWNGTGPLPALPSPALPTYAAGSP